MPPVQFFARRCSPRPLSFVRVCVGIAAIIQAFQSYRILAAWLLPETVKAKDLWFIPELRPMGLPGSASPAGTCPLRLRGLECWQAQGTGVVRPSAASDGSGSGSCKAPAVGRLEDPLVNRPATLRPPGSFSRSLGLTPLPPLRHARLAFGRVPGPGPGRPRYRRHAAQSKRLSPFGHMLTAFFSGAPRGRPHRARLRPAQHDSRRHELHS